LNDEHITENFSIRIDKRVLDKLRKHAKMEGTSLNSMINSLLTFDVDWHIPAASSGWVPIPKSILTAIMEKLDDNEISDIVENVARKTLKDLVLAMKGKYATKEMLEVLGGRSKAAGFHYSEVDEGDNIHFIMQHNMGKKWSLYFKSFYEMALNDLGCKAKFTMTDNTVTYTINKKDYK
jgi:hypothetical protein